MIKFLKRFFAFIALFAAILCFSALLYYLVKKDYFSNGHLFFGTNVKTLIIGDSHTQTALDDSIIPNSKNVSFSGEHYLFTYFKLKHILEDNKQIDKVILGVGYHNFSEFVDQRIFDSGKTSRAYSRYFMLLDREGIMDTKNNSLNWRINYLKHKFYIPFQLKLEIKLVLKSIINEKIKADDFPFIGKFYSSDETNFVHNEKDIKTHFYNDSDQVLGISALNFKYLLKIAHLTSNNDISLYVINTPLHKSYSDKVPLKFEICYSNLVSNLEKKYSNVTELKLDTLRYDDDLFGDGHHLNIKGAKSFSERVTDMVN